MKEGKVVYICKKCGSDKLKKLSDPRFDFECLNCGDLKHTKKFRGPDVYKITGDNCTVVKV